MHQLMHISSRLCSVISHCYLEICCSKGMYITKISTCYTSGLLSPPLGMPVVKHSPAHHYRLPLFAWKIPTYTPRQCFSVMLSLTPIEEQGEEHNSSVLSIWMGRFTYINLMPLLINSWTISLLLHFTHEQATRSASNGQSR